MKDRISFSSCCEALEAPMIESSRHHYYPSKFAILRKMLIRSRNNKRIPYPRSQKCYGVRGTSKHYKDIKVINEKSNETQSDLNS